MKSSTSTSATQDTLHVLAQFGGIILDVTLGAFATMTILDGLITRAVFWIPICVKHINPSSDLLFLWLTGRFP